VTPFRLLDAASTREAAALLRTHAPHARPIAAGGDLLGLLKEGVAGSTLPTPQVLVNLASVRELARIEVDAAAWRIGAMVTLAQLARTDGLPPMICEAVARIASPQLRARTTLGGNLLQRPRCLYFRHPDIVCFKKGGSTCAALGGPARAHPGALVAGRCRAGHPSDLAPVLIALDAHAQIVSSHATRTLPLAELYRGAADNATSEVQLRDDELVAALIVPGRPCAQAFEKVAPRAANEFAWTGAAVALQCDGATIRSARVAASGLAPEPHAFDVRHLAGCSVHELRPSELACALVPLEPDDDVLAARVAAARLAIERALARALRCAGALHNPRSDEPPT
jgi:xanthine dehydrogenase YagS FAD-binding subunit